MWLDRILGRKLRCQDNSGDAFPSPGYDFDQYPYEVVTADIVDRTALEVVNASMLGFDLLKKRTWAKQVVPGIVQLFSLRATKGGGFVFIWGVSLGFVPHEWESKPKFHRTLKSARYDLFEDAAEFIVHDPHSAELGQYVVEGIRGEEVFKKTMNRTWGKLCPYLLTWFNETATLTGVLAKAENQVSHHWKSFCHFPDPRLVVAFCLAKLGRMEEARHALKLLISDQSEEYGNSLLAEALESARENDCSPGT
jgi:hypothetical protein